MSATALAMMLMVSVHICHGKTPVTYAFPTDSCVSDPYLVDENTMVYMKFEGDFGSSGCRQMSFTTPKSAFYSYTMCMKELYYSSPKCQSKVYFKKYWSDFYNYDYNNDQILGEGCSGNSYGDNRMFSRCLDDVSHVSFELKKSKHGLIGGIAGGFVGMCVLTAVGIYVCLNCRRRKRQTGRYCCTCPTYRPKYSNAKFTKLNRVVVRQKVHDRRDSPKGFSAECTVARYIIVCSCVLCRRQTRNGQEEEQCA
ncbi:unnamed protein product [Mytilus coruscus]|uniref:Uncharacterized protein n=1 Tax=Mytilus coruscus TaxID=42192 RepID=A0A6J8CRB0_MYTCO|nr:unnamed protein product [Mytilus coruscus]